MRSLKHTAKERITRSAKTPAMVDAGLDVLMVDAGPTLAKRPGAHLKNAYKYQRDVNSFAAHIRGALHTLSIPTNFSGVPTLDPLAFNPQPVAGGLVRGNQNPYQKEFDNLPAAAATYGVGGMATHWTCACPRPAEVERNWLFPSEESYQKAEMMLRVNQKAFMEFSIRDRVLNKVLRQAFVERTGLNPDSKKPGEKYTIGPQPLPPAAQRNRGNPECVTWTGTDVLLGDRLIDMANAGPSEASRFTLLDNHVCKRLVLNRNTDHVEAVVLKDGVNGGEKTVTANTFVLAAGTVLTPQLLWHSLQLVSKEAVMKLPALGRYLSEQPMAFCQVVWRGDIIAKEFEPYHRGNLAIDPIPIDVHDSEPNQWLPCTTERPWHAQIHRDAFAYGDLAPNVDSRLIVDLRFFGIVDQRYENCVEFRTCADKGINDIFGLPQPTFHYTYSTEEKLRMHAMMEEMLYYAGKIGGFLPGSEPQFTKPGLTLHIHGSTRVGQGPSDSVVNRFGKVHGITNLYLGGNGLIPKGIACNPTLTSVAYALDSAAHILGTGNSTV